ncbi:hypothetical protein [Halopiger aswanensis]|uniref:Uncharacterized protein n=1 Tax=Halopiger aswanensis TaxID=148449 RepID=A0A419WE67_9EURY|nr:hypothetical protein [Halopiger aswanensis]RKD93771.1 hypothetical protein ATJ93_3403 [Halopiger aswanensis]
MSADRHPSQAQSPEAQSDYDQPGPAATDVELAYRSSAASTEAHSSTAAASASASTGSTTAAPEPPLSHRIEQTKLEARVTALERALETSEYRQQEIVTQYERLLAERTDETTRDDSSTDAATEDNGLLKRLLERWR